MVDDQYPKIPSSLNINAINQPLFTWLLGSVERLFVQTYGGLDDTFGMVSDDLDFARIAKSKLQHSSVNSQ